VCALHAIHNHAALDYFHCITSHTYKSILRIQCDDNIKIRLRVVAVQRHEIRASAVEVSGIKASTNIWRVHASAIGSRALTYREYDRLGHRACWTLGPFSLTTAYGSLEKLARAPNSQQSDAQEIALYNTCRMIRTIAEH